MPTHLARVHLAHHPARDGPAQGRRRLQLFNLDLHIGVISDLKDLFADLDIGVTDWTLSAHAGAIGRHREPVLVVNELTWRSIGPEMVTEFDRRYGRYLSGFDGFICTYPPAFIPLFMRYDKPIIGVAATRYEQPFTADRTRWSWLDSELRKASEGGQLSLVANNRADRDYLKHFTGLDSALISSMCRYPRAPFTGRLPAFAIASRDTKLDSMIERGTADAAQARGRLFHGRPSWSQLHDVRGWVHIPYNVSQMALFEQYYAGVPIFVPNERLLMELHHQHPGAVLSEISFYQIRHLDQSQLAANDPNKTTAPSVLRWWVDRADFSPGGELREVSRFGSIDELSHLLRTSDVASISERYRENNVEREQRVLSQWSSLLQNSFDL
jgi:hypothetical protein